MQCTIYIEENWNNSRRNSFTLEYHLFVIYSQYIKRIQRISLSSGWNASFELSRNLSIILKTLYIKPSIYFYSGLVKRKKNFLRFSKNGLDNETSLFFMKKKKRISEDCYKMV